MKELDVLEIEYSELATLQPYSNSKFGIRIKTTPATYEQDMLNLIIEVKTRLNKIITERRKEIEEEKKIRKTKKKAQEILAGVE
jgi:hypothetical protein